MRRLTFRRCGYAGVAAAAALALVLAGRVGVSLLLEAGLIVTACLGFLALAYVTRVVAGRERLVYYHHEIAVLALVALVAGLAGGPVLSALDATALGLGLFLACGRVGCLVAGCCHGRPARHGIVYGPDHAENGFTRHLVGVPLIPVQAIESALVVALVAAGAALTLSGAPPGTGFTLYVTGYAVIRFGLEFLRGDPLRPYWRGASEAQWTSTLLACLVALAAVVGVVPDHPWDIVAAAALLAALAGTVTRARRPPAVLHPRHLQEVVRTVAALSSERPGGALASAPAVFHTSAGVQLSCGVVDDRLHVAMSRGRPALDLVGAQALACVIGGLRPRAEMECVVGPEDVWHVLLRG